MNPAIVILLLCLCAIFYAWTTRRGSRGSDRRLRGGSDAGAGTDGYVYADHGQRDAGSTGGNSDCSGDAGGGGGDCGGGD